MPHQLDKSPFNQWNPSNPSLYTWQEVYTHNQERLRKLPTLVVISNIHKKCRDTLPNGTPSSIKKNMKDTIQKEIPDQISLKIGVQVVKRRNKNLWQNLIVNGESVPVSETVYVHFTNSGWSIISWR